MKRQLHTTQVGAIGYTLGNGQTVGHLLFIDFFVNSFQFQWTKAFRAVIGKVHLAGAQ